MFLKSARRGYQYLVQKFALLSAFFWIWILKHYASNPQEGKEKQLSAIKKMLYWRKKCGLDIREFVRVTHKWGYNLPNILRALTKS